MGFQIHLQPSDLTPPPAVFKTLVGEALAARKAVWEDEEAGDLLLTDETEIGLFTDDEENVAVFVLEGQNEAAFDLVHDLADRTASFITVDGRACATPSAGDLPGGQEALHGPPERLATREDLGDWLRVAMRQASQPATPTAAPNPGPSGQPQRSLFQRLSDALFGKSI